MAPMLLNFLNLATGMQDLTPIDAQDLRKSNRNHAARQIYHAARDCFSCTTPRVKLPHATRDQGRGETDLQHTYYAARRCLHTPGVVAFFLHAVRDASHAARDQGSGKSIF
ncbi:hypothetical protein L195_g039346 [Trifolium pratense]|uniref:Uncharacterized protein n=1 Tax=Trifolium pratense TaxID=57577 RepID=A0A2K3LXP8_TRIPR|nr:hypothetical protein L195_g039346 [Trifolium pratense]